jgi:hypothetical protein
MNASQAYEASHTVANANARVFFAEKDALVNLWLPCVNALIQHACAKGIQKMICTLPTADYLDPTLLKAVRTEVTKQFEAKGYIVTGVDNTLAISWED